MTHYVTKLLYGSTPSGGIDLDSFGVLSLVFKHKIQLLIYVLFYVLLKSFLFKIVTFTCPLHKQKFDFKSYN